MLSNALHNAFSIYLNHLSDKYRILTPSDPSRQGGIFTFRHSDSALTANLFAELQSLGVICALRGGGIRLSPHFYTPFNQLERVLNVINQF